MTKAELLKAINLLIKILSDWATLDAISEIHFAALCYEGTKLNCPSKDEQYYYSHYLALGITAIETIIDILARISKEFNESIGRNTKILTRVIIGIMAFNGGTNLGYFLQLFYSFIVTLIADISLSTNYIAGDELWGLITAAVIFSSILISNPSRLLVKKLLEHFCTCFSANGQRISGILHNILSAFVNAFAKIHNAVSIVQGFTGVTIESWSARIWRITLGSSAAIGAALQERGAFKFVKNIRWLPQSVQDWLTQGSAKEITIPKLAEFSLTFDQIFSIILIGIGTARLLEHAPRPFLLTAGGSLLGVWIALYIVSFIAGYCFPKLVYTFSEPINAEYSQVASSESESVEEKQRSQEESSGEESEGFDTSKEKTVEEEPLIQEKHVKGKEEEEEFLDYNRLEGLCG